MKKLYIRRASELVTCRGSAPKKGAEMADIGLIKNGGVLIHDDQIFAVGTTEELDLLAGFEEGSGQADACTETASGYTVLDASGKTVLPGFVDSHTHFIFGGYRAEEFSWRLKGDTYMSIMERHQRHRRPHQGRLHPGAGFCRKRTDEPDAGVRRDHR